MITLRPLTLEDAQQIRLWRNADLSPWRTSHLLTEEMQEEWYRNEVCNRHSNSRWWAVEDSELVGVTGSGLVGMVGLTHIQFENRLAEVNLIMEPDAWQQGNAAVDLLLEQAFDHLGLATVCGEYYGCASNFAFWDDAVTGWMVEDWSETHRTVLPRRKFWKGAFHDSLYFSLSDEAYREMKGRAPCPGS